MIAAVSSAVLSVSLHAASSADSLSTLPLRTSMT
jgi:hypothetical protein